jgi:hypothetical protein
VAIVRASGSEGSSGHPVATADTVEQPVVGHPGVSTSGVTVEQPVVGHPGVSTSGVTAEAPVVGATVPETVAVAPVGRTSGAGTRGRAATGET